MAEKSQGQGGSAKSAPAGKAQGRQDGSGRSRGSRNRNRSRNRGGQGGANNRSPKAASKADSQKKVAPRRSLPGAEGGAQRNKARRPRGGRRIGGDTVLRSSSAKRDRRRAIPPKPRREEEYYPAPSRPDTVRVVPLGGVEEVGRNMTVIEANGDIFVLDVGFQFVSEGSVPGIDYMLPNTKYLEANKDRIAGVIITHGHLDHIGGIPFVMGRIGNPPIYTQQLTSFMVKKRQEEYPDAPKLDIKEVKVGDRLKIGNTFVKFFSVTHSIPDSMGVSIESPQGNVVITGDLKLDHKDGQPAEHEVKKWGQLGKDKNLFFIADSTNAEQQGFSMPERNVLQTIEEIIKYAKGRLVIGTFASQFKRMVSIIETSEKLGKKVVTEGRSIRTNIEIAEHIGLLKANKGTIIPASEADKYPPDRVVIISTGSQGEEFAALMRIATGKHKFIKLSKHDTVVLSSSVIPGNEIAVQKLKDNLYRHDITLMHYRSSNVHSTGHGNQKELVWISKQVGAKYFMPAYGYHSMLRNHARTIEQSGFPKDRMVIPDNGTIIEFKKGVMRVEKKKVPSAPLLVDGIAIGDKQEVVIHDRQSLADSGTFVVIATVDLRTGKLKSAPDIITRGFVRVREGKQLIQQARALTKKTVEDRSYGMSPVDLDYVKKELAEVLESFLFNKTNKLPIVIPALIGV